MTCLSRSHGLWSEETLHMAVVACQQSIYVSSHPWTQSNPPTHPHILSSPFLPSNVEMFLLLLLLLLLLRLLCPSNHTSMSRWSKYMGGRQTFPKDLGDGGSRVRVWPSKSYMLIKSRLACSWPSRCPVSKGGGGRMGNLIVWECKRTWLPKTLRFKGGGNGRIRARMLTLRACSCAAYVCMYEKKGKKKSVYDNV